MGTVMAAVTDKIRTHLRKIETYDSLSQELSKQTQGWFEVSLCDFLNVPCKAVIAFVITRIVHLKIFLSFQS